MCFNPTNDLILLSGGQIDKDVKVWNSETGINIANLSGHSGDIHSIKMAADGSFAISVSTDKKILLDVLDKMFAMQKPETLMGNFAPITPIPMAVQSHALKMKFCAQLR